jgi:hypothetical protein
VAGERRDDAAAEMAKADDYYFNQKDTASAIAHYEAARRLAPDRPGPYLALGIAYASLGQCGQAIPMMQKYLSLKTSDPKTEAQKTIDECNAKLAATCPSGMVKSADTAGHCCWPGQVWVQTEARCVGQPRCPSGFVLGPHHQGCLATGSCPPGKVLSQDPRQCCWPGQGYSHEQKACVGAPTCPPNMVAAGEDCRPAPTGRVAPRPVPRPAALPGPLDKETIRVSMNRRVKPLVAVCYSQYRAPGEVRITFSVLPDGTVQKATVLPPFANTPIGICLEETLRSASFPPFTGPVQTITYPFALR